MKYEAKSFKQIMEDALKESFEKMLNEALSKSISEFQKQNDKIIKEARVEIKKQANKLTLEVLQKSDISGISVELKL